MQDTTELLRQFAQAVEVLERGCYPPTVSDRTRLVEALVNEICAAPWQTSEEREKAQNLVARLERVKWKGSAPAVNPTNSTAAPVPPPRPMAPALTADMIRRWRQKKGSPQRADS